DVTVAVNHRVKKAAEGGDLVGGPGHAAVHHVKDAGADDHQPGVKKHSWIVLRVGIAEQHRGDSVDDQPYERKHVGRDAGERQAAHDGMQQPAAAPSKCSRPSHVYCASSWMVMRFSTSSSRLPLGVTTTAVSPTLLPIRALPMGEVVEIN